ncbi:hypothetical protein U1Q18_041302 [Sarracenia purpurea var. burkii]
MNKWVIGATTCFSLVTVQQKRHAPFLWAQVTNFFGCRSPYGPSFDSVELPPIDKDKPRLPEVAPASSTENSSDETLMDAKLRPTYFQFAPKDKGQGKVVKYPNKKRLMLLVTLADSVVKRGDKRFEVVPKKTTGNILLEINTQKLVDTPLESGGNRTAKVTTSPAALSPIQGVPTDQPVEKSEHIERSSSEPLA